MTSQTWGLRGVWTGDEEMRDIDRKRGGISYYL